MEGKIRKIQQKYLEEIRKANTLKRLDEIFLALFGKNGELTLLPKEFPKLKTEELKLIGPLFNEAKTELENTVELKREETREISYQKLTQEKLDLSQPTQIKKRQGHLHPIVQLENETVKLFNKLGFQQFEAPQIDTDYYNFEVLNIPQGHPARDLWDTLYLDPDKSGIEMGKLLLRTHTSNAQIRIMKKFKLPIRAMNIGRNFRYENLDPRHEHTLEQFEIVYIDKGVSMSNLQYLSEYFLKGIFGQEIKVRLRPKYYPFVEPGAGVDGQCIFCKGKGCKICGWAGWLELAGAGMIHPTVLKNGGIDANIYSGIAWGFGPERMAMLKYGIEDIRLFNSGNLRFLEKF